MNIKVKIELIFVTVTCLLSGINADRSCQHIDFNKTESISKIEQCSSGGNEFVIQSYLEKPLTPFREGFVNYLTNILPGTSCFSAVEYFTFDGNAEFYFALYLQSNVIEDDSNIEIQLIDMGGSMFPIMNAVATDVDEWNELYIKYEKNFENVKIAVRAHITTDTIVAMQYFHIANSALEDPQCDKDAATTTEITTIDTTTEDTTIDTTTEDTTIDTTTEDTTIDTSSSPSTATTDRPTLTTITSPSTPSDTNGVWMIISFVFFLTTIIVAVGSIYLIYLYKTTLAMKTTLMGASNVNSNLASLPRLTVATSSQGHQVIVGIKNMKQF